MIEAKPHPAKFSEPILAVLLDVVKREWEAVGRPLRILDPYAGTGRCFALAEYGSVSAVELEPEWAAHDPRVIVGDAGALPFADDTFDVAAFSPCYGNRMADSHVAKDTCKLCQGTGSGPGVLWENGKPSSDQRCPGCKGSGLSRRNTYTHKLGRKPSRGSTAVLQWGYQYRVATERHCIEIARTLKPGSLAVINISNHIRDGVEQRVVEWWLNWWLVRGCTLIEARRVPTQRLGDGANREARVDGEMVLVLRLP